MSRYFYYLVVLYMLANVVALVPRILIQDRLNGTVMALVIAIVLTMFYFYIFTNSMLKFPGKGQPEIVLTYTPKWFAFTYLFFVAILYFCSAWFILVSFIDITNIFINPEMPSFLIGAVFLALVSFGALMKTEKTLYALEIVLLISLPLIIAIFFKAYFNQLLSWDAIKVVFIHSFEKPSISTIGAASYSMIGFYFISIYNRVLKPKVNKLKLIPFLLLGILATVNIFTSFLIPIGFNGVDGSENYIYPWFSTADSIRMEFGFIERVLFIFLLLYIGISISTATITCHVGVETLKSILPKKKWKGIAMVPSMILLVFSVFTISSPYLFSQVHIFDFSKFYFSLLLLVGAISCSVLLYAVRRSKSK
ncbi:GerAB/ArcD/ProY family transporter [Salinibacillus xinjiangensis]|uniref:GerAB/ArcD/ProY family transporter n=1 Tax=Salinibacillus xinjiangensis TaxID=1229268 RepID=UPI0018912040|nr:GerAB/ArcD/ProY family transporter [Salinibacillus xinjiangensis]